MLGRGGVGWLRRAGMSLEPFPTARLGQGQLSAAGGVPYVAWLARGSSSMRAIRSRHGERRGRRRARKADLEDAKRHVLHSWSVQDTISPIAVAGGEGRYFWDYDGKRYLDFASQMVNLALGHEHPKIVAAIGEQAKTAVHDRSANGERVRSRLGRLLAEVTPGDLTMSFFTNGGAEANENAIKLARGTRGGTRSSRATAPTTARRPARSP